MKVPFIVYIPKQYKELYPAEPGSEIDQLISFIDLAPTAIELAGAQIPKNMQGQAFWEKILDRKEIMYSWPEAGWMNAMISKRGQVKDLNTFAITNLKNRSYST